MRLNILPAIVCRVASLVASGAFQDAAKVLEGLEKEDLQKVRRIFEAEEMGPVYGAAARYMSDPEERSLAHRLIREALSKSLIFEKSLRKLQKTLDSASPNFLFIKGAVLRSLVYPEPWLRSMRDVDLLVPPQNSEAIIRLLQAAGFQTEAYPSSRKVSVKFSCERKLRDKETHVLVEVHTGLTYEPFGLRGDVGGLLARSIQYPFGPAPCPEDHLLVIAIHQARTGMLAGVHHYQDVDRIIATSTIHWEALVERAKGWGASAALHFTLQVSRMLFGTPVPPWVLSSTAPKGLEGAALRALLIRGPAITKGFRLRPAGPGNDNRRLFYDVWRPAIYAATLDRWSSRLAFAAYFLATRLGDLVAAIDISAGQSLT